MGQTKSIYRYEVPIDDQDHVLNLRGGWPVQAAAVLDGNKSYVEFWAEHLPDEDEEETTFCVFGTGQDIPAEYWHAATAPRVAGLVFHLYEKVDFEV